MFYLLSILRKDGKEEKEERESQRERERIKKKWIYLENMIKELCDDSTVHSAITDAVEIAEFI